MSSVRGVSTAAALTVVTTIGAIGFLAGPPLIGLIAQATSLTASFGLVTVLVAALMLSAGALRSAAVGKAAGTAEPVDAPVRAS